MENKDLKHPCTLISVIALVVSLISLSFSLNSDSSQGSVQGKNDIAPVAPVVEEESAITEVELIVSPKVYVADAGPEYFTFHAAIPLVSAGNFQLFQGDTELTPVDIFTDNRGELVIKILSADIIQNFPATDFHLIGLDFFGDTQITIK